MGIKWFLLFLLIIPIVSGSIRINEVMADPDVCFDSVCEWVELYNDGNSAINLSGWIIGDGQQNDTLEWNPSYGNGSTMIPAKGYAIITDHGTEVYGNFSVSMESIKLYVNDFTLVGYGLNNNGETLYLYKPNNDSVDSFSYYEVYPGLSCSFDNETIWCKSDPTPGYFNQGSFIDFFTGACDWYINLILNKTEFEESDFEFKIDVKKNGGGKANVNLIREVKNVYGNTVSSYSPLTKYLTYGSNFGGPWSPNYSPGMYWLKVCIETDCNEVRLDNNCDERLFVIKSEEMDDNSSIKFRRVYDLGNDGIAKFGQIIKVKLDAYKGDTNKEAITFHVEDEDGKRISKDSKVNVLDKYRNYSLTIPVQLIPNCERKFEDGEYYIVVEGLGDRDKEKLEVSGINSLLCETIKETIIKDNVYSEISESESVLKDDYVTTDVVYEGDNQEKYAIYFFCFSLVMLIIHFIWKK